MKIYNYIKMDIDGNVIEEDSYNYHGGVAECKGSAPAVPPPTEEEKALQKETLLQLQESRELQKQFLPILMQTSGYKYDDEGNVTKMGYDEYLGTLDPAMRTQYENLNLIQEQTSKALRGEMDVSPSLEQGLTDRRQRMEQNLSRRLGSNWGLSSAGIKSMEEFDKSADALREQARHGAINQYGTLGLQGTQQFGLTPGVQMSTASSFPAYQGGLLPSYDAALQPYQQQRAMQFESNRIKAQTASQERGALMGGIGTIAGMGLGGYMGGLFK